MNRILRMIMIGAIGSMISMSLNAATLSVGCTINESSGKPDIWFAGITGGTFNQNNYGKKGTLSVTALVSGKGNTAKFSTQSRYKKVGNRLEIRKVWITVPVTMKEFKGHFGLFPKLTCTSP